MLDFLSRLNPYVTMVFSHIQVIKKVMKMDAAEPFNVPVNPVALGIPVSMNYYVKCSGSVL